MFLLTHPDKDHCTGLLKHFHLGPVEDYIDDHKNDNEKKIIIGEIWSSPMVFRRASKSHVLCEDARAFNQEVKRRVKINRERSFMNIPFGDFVLILGEDIEGKTDNLGPILIKTNSLFSLRGNHTLDINCRLLAPTKKQEDEIEELLSKNHSSVILNISIAASETERNGCSFLIGGDAEVAIWEHLWGRYKDTPEVLKYDLLLVPHHCSWHSLSSDSWSEKKEEAKVSADALLALSQTRGMVSIISSSKAVVDDGCDPPCIRAKREYIAIASKAGGVFYCTGEHGTNKNLIPLEFNINNDGVSFVKNKSSASSVIISTPAPRVG